MILDIPYNTQIDNAVGRYGQGQITVGPSAQCGYNMQCHVMYPLTHDASDAWVARYVGSLENTISPDALGTMVKASMGWYWIDPRTKAYLPNRRVGAAINAHALACEIMAVQIDPSISVVMRAQGNRDEICRAIDGGSPVGIFTQLTPSGHFIALIGYEHTANGLVFVAHDSYGNFYPSWNPQSLGKGASVRYPADWLLSRLPGGWGWYYYWKRS